MMNIQIFFRSKTVSMIFRNLKQDVVAMGACHVTKIILINCDGKQISRKPLQILVYSCSRSDWNKNIRRKRLGRFINAAYVDIPSIVIG